MGAEAFSWNTMVTDRILFGVGGESMQVAQNCLLFRLCKGHEVAFALAVNLSIARAGSVLTGGLGSLLDCGAEPGAGRETVGTCEAPEGVDTRTVARKSCSGDDQ